VAKPVRPTDERLQSVQAWCIFWVDVGG
jgi:hypothetical protein